MKKLVAEFIGTLRLILGSSGSAVLAGLVYKYLIERDIRYYKL